MTKRAGLARAMLVLWGVLLCAPAQADAIFVVFEGPAAGALPVKGAALDDEMAKLGALEVDSLDFGIENSLVIDPREGATGPGRAAFLPLRMVLAWVQACRRCCRPRVPAATTATSRCTFARAAGRPVDHATLALKLVAVTGVEVSAGADGPQARVTLTYGSMKLDVYPVDAKGEVAKTPETGQWNAMTGTADFSTVPTP